MAGLLTPIFESYGQFDATNISKEEQNISLMVWNLNNLPIISYNAVTELVSLDKAGNVPNTQAQIFNIGVKMIWKTQDFETGLSKWFKHAAVAHTW